jgi:hypothetical protein
MKLFTHRADFLAATTATQSAVLKVTAPALEAYAKLQGDAVTPEEARQWRRRYSEMPFGMSKREAAQIIAEDSDRSWETIRRHI